MTATRPSFVPTRVGDPLEIDYSAMPAEDFGPLARDRIPVRSLRPDDAKAIVAIDKRIGGRDRSAYFARKISDALDESDVRVSLVAEIDGRLAGFVMARVDLGEYGRTDQAAVLDTIGVDPDCRNLGVGRALLSQLLVNLTSLRIDTVRTELDWVADRELLGFLAACGFAPAQRLAFEKRFGD